MNYWCANVENVPFLSNQLGDVFIHKIPTEYGVGSWDISEEGEYVIFRSCLDSVSVYVAKDYENAPIKQMAIWFRIDQSSEKESSWLPQGKTYHLKYTRVQNMRVVCGFKFA